MVEREHAAFIGAGIAGLTAAAALAGGFERVTALERDGLADTPAFRPDVPQSRHLHSLMRAGQRALDELLPGFTERLYGAGAVPLRTSYDPDPVPAGLAAPPARPARRPGERTGDAVPGGRAVAASELRRRVR